jgi:hypothetical protein
LCNIGLGVKIKIIGAESMGVRWLGAKQILRSVNKMVVADEKGDGNRDRTRL